MTSITSSLSSALCTAEFLRAHAALVWKSGSSPYGDILSSYNHAVQELFVPKGKCSHSAGGRGPAPKGPRLFVEVGGRAADR